MMRFVHQTKAHISDIFTTTKKILCQVLHSKYILWLGTTDMEPKGKLFCKAREAFFVCVLCEASAVGGLESLIHMQECT